MRPGPPYPRPPRRRAADGMRLITGFVIFCWVLGLALLAAAVIVAVHFLAKVW